MILLIMNIFGQLFKSFTKVKIDKLIKDNE